MRISVRLAPYRTYVECYGTLFSCPGPGLSTPPGAPQTGTEKNQLRLAHSSGGPSVSVVETRRGYGGGTEWSGGRTMRKRKGRASILDPAETTVSEGEEIKRNKREYKKKENHRNIWKDRGTWEKL